MQTIVYDTPSPLHFHRIPSFLIFHSTSSLCSSSSSSPFTTTAITTTTSPAAASASAAAMPPRQRQKSDRSVTQLRYWTADVAGGHTIGKWLVDELEDDRLAFFASFVNWSACQVQRVKNPGTKWPGVEEKEGEQRSRSAASAASQCSCVHPAAA